MWLTRLEGTTRYGVGRLIWTESTFGTLEVANAESLEKWRLFMR